ncbi:beta-galactoside alpha-2,6-sialyltransferase 2 [Anopheles nili]|uniref:beta-galactoside alpha-2,6-sialyltransferase 2 n=1 Tax=Anopheles nili TaxID=185578 RepID=UPI00237AC2E0|nr:beta-galactoside alpha-2,6-sialyltransferase 2 [Anopheles nili]
MFPLCSCTLVPARSASVQKCIHLAVLLLAILAVPSHAVEKRSVFYVKHNSTEKSHKSVSSSDEKPTLWLKDHDAPRVRPHFSLTKTSNFLFDLNRYRCNDSPYSVDCINRTTLFRAKIIGELRRRLKEPFPDGDHYQVRYGRPLEPIVSPICRMLRANVRVLSWKEPPFTWNEIGSYLPTTPLFGDVTNGSCVIVASAGSLKRSQLGPFIDGHDIVMRFNHAPTEGFEADVGSKTTIRVVNSQVVTKPDFRLLTATLFRNITIAAWDPGKFEQTLAEWLASPDFNLFENFKKFRTNHPQANFHIIDPRSIWRAWTALQDLTQSPIRKNPPTSGFIGLGLLMPVCRYIDIVEYIPSTRMNGLCHYYDDELNLGCTFGAWHPLAAEKLLVFQLNSADDYSVFQQGTVRIRTDQLERC